MLANFPVWKVKNRFFIISKQKKKKELISKKYLKFFKKRDVIGIAETGSGKTLGFLVPGIVKILAENKNIKRVKQPSILVLAPTRELAMQGDETCNNASAKTGIKSICIAGGMDRNAQTNAITRGTQVFISPFLPSLYYLFSLSSFILLHEPVMLSVSQFFLHF